VRECERERERVRDGGSMEERAVDTVSLHSVSVQSNPTCIKVTYNTTLGTYIPYIPYPHIFHLVPIVQQQLGTWNLDWAPEIP
jgi:hypothetical protein